MSLASAQVLPGKKSLFTRVTDRVGHVLHPTSSESNIALECELRPLNKRSCRVSRALSRRKHQLAYAREPVYRSTPVCTGQLAGVHVACRPAHKRTVRLGHVAPRCAVASAGSLRCSLGTVAALCSPGFAPLQGVYLRCERLPWSLPSFLCPDHNQTPQLRATSSARRSRRSRAVGDAAFKNYVNVRNPIKRFGFLKLDSCVNLTGYV